MTTPTLLNKPKIIFFDIDETLYVKATNSVPDSVKTALLALQQNGIIVAIATGRSLGIFPECVRSLIDDVGIELFVTINGQYNQFKGSRLIGFPLPSALIHTTTKYLREQQVAYAYMTHDQIIAFCETHAMKHALDSLHIAYQVADDSVATNMANCEPIYQMLAFFDDNSQVALDLDEALKSVRWHLSGVDILQKDGSKSRGIQAVLDKLGLQLADAMAFGDGLNDIEMIQNVGYGIAMGNAHPTLKAVADYVCPRHDEDGIYHALKTLGLI